MIHAAGVGICVLVLIIKPALLQKQLYDLIPLDFLGLMLCLLKHTLYMQYKIFQMLLSNFLFPYFHTISQLVLESL